MKGLGLGAGMGSTMQQGSAASGGDVPKSLDPFNMLLAQDDMLLGAYSSYATRVNPQGTPIGDGKGYVTSGSDVTELINLLGDHPDHPAYAQRWGNLVHEGDPNYFQDAGDTVNGLRALTPEVGASFYGTTQVGGLTHEDPYTIIRFFVEAETNKNCMIMEYASGAIYSANRGGGFYRSILNDIFTTEDDGSRYNPVGRDPTADNSGLPLVWAYGKRRGPWDGEPELAAQSLYAESTQCTNPSSDPSGKVQGAAPIKFLLRHRLVTADARWLGAIITKRDPLQPGDREWLEAYCAQFYQAAGRTALIYNASPWKVDAPQTVDMTSESQIHSVHLAYNSINPTKYSAYVDPITKAVSEIEPTVGAGNATQPTGAEQMTYDEATTYNGTPVLRSGGTSGTEGGNRSFLVSGMVLNPAVNDIMPYVMYASAVNDGASVASLVTADTASNRWMRRNGGTVEYRATNPPDSGSEEVTPDANVAFPTSACFIAGHVMPAGEFDTLGCFNVANGEAVAVNTSTHGAVWNEVYSNAEFRALYEGGSHEWLAWGILLCTHEHPDFDRLMWVLADQRNQLDMLESGSGAATKYATHGPKALVGVSVAHAEPQFEFDQTEFNSGEFA